MRVIVDGKPITISGSLLRVAGVSPAEEHFYDVWAPEEIIDALKERKIRADLFTFWQRIPETAPKFSYHFEWDNVAAIPLKTYEGWLKSQVHQNTRNKIKKAAKNGIEVRVVPFDDTLVNGMIEIFNESRIRQGRQFSHYGKSFQEVKEEWSSDSERCEFVGAYFGTELVGFIKLLNAGKYHKKRLFRLRHTFPLSRRLTSLDYAPAYRLQFGYGDQRTFVFFPGELRHRIDTQER